MSAETLINAALTADAQVIAVVPATRIASDFLSQEFALPAIVYLRSETEYVNTIHPGPPAAEKVTMETWCMAQTRIAAEALADKVITALSNSDFDVIGRRPEHDAETAIYAAIVSSDIWIT